MGTVADLTWPSAAGREGRLLVVPVGATEQHGPHLPLSTDTDIAQALAARLARRRGDVDVAPAVPYGASGEHAAFPGTLSVGSEALRLLLVELCRSATSTWSRVLLLSAHGGNADAVRSAVALLRTEGRDVKAWSPSWRGDAHAGRTETSLQLSLQPARVLQEHAAAGATAPIADLLPLLRAGGVAGVAPNGVLGDPTGANGVEGDLLLTAASAELDRWLG